MLCHHNLHTVVIPGKTTSTCEDLLTDLPSDCDRWHHTTSHSLRGLDNLVRTLCAYLLHPPLLTYNFSLIYAAFCIITYVWVALYVPETRGVPLGKAMDELFKSSKASDTDTAEIEEVEDIDENTALLYREREIERRRSSFAGFN